MKELLTILVSLLTIIPPLIMRNYAGKILREDIPKEEKLYKGTKVMVACIVLAFLMYFPPMMALEALDRVSNFVDGITSNIFLGALLFMAILISPLLLSITLIIMSAVKIETSVKELEVGKGEILNDILKFFALIILPGIAWFALYMTLPESIREKMWLVFVVFALYILTIFALAPHLIFWLEKSKPIDENLKKELMEFCESLGVKVRDVKIVGKKEYKVANAGVSGIIPKYRYIFVTPHLLENFEEDEIKAVLAHEIEHIKGKHLWINATLTIGWFVFWVGLVYALHKLGIKLFSSPWVFFGVFFFAYFTYLFIIEAKIALRNEFKADEFAAKIVGKEATIRALEKLAELNLTPKRTGKWFNILSFHPSIEERIRHLGG